ADLSDASSGVNPTSVAISVDGINVTANATVTSSQVSYTPLAALANGRHSVTVYAADNLGNGASANWSFIVNSSPEITNPQPPHMSITSDTTPLISADLTDVDRGIKISSVTLSFDGINVTAGANVTSSRVWYLPTIPLAETTHSVAVYAEDNAGNSASTNWSFTIAIPPLISNTRTTGVGSTTAIISWDTDKASDSLVMFGTSPGSYIYQKSDDRMVLSHIIQLAGLTPGATHYYKVRSTDPIGAFSESEQYSFATKSLVSIAVTPANPTILRSLKQQFVASGINSDNTTDNLTSAVIWTSSNTSVATVSAAGLATSLAAGATNIIATLGVISGNTTLTVTQAATVEVNSGNTITLNTGGSINAT
ncbi:MAG: Ig-like domain-containing protein, partial [Chloroflexota bacterium]